jgi:hypothetical protein
MTAPRAKVAELVETFSEVVFVRKISSHITPDEDCIARFSFELEKFYV